MKSNNRSGQLLEELINRKGETKVQFAEAINVTPGMVSQWISGYRNPFSNQSTITKIAEHFNISADYLLGIDTPAVDAEMNEYLIELKNRSEMRMMFKTLKGATKKDIEQAVAIVETLKKQSKKENE
jgi:Helix-turn-helix.